MSSDRVYEAWKDAAGEKPLSFIRWTDSNRSSSGFVFLCTPVLRCDDLWTPGPEALVQDRRRFPSPWLATVWRTSQQTKKTQAFGTQIDNAHYQIAPLHMHLCTFTQRQTIATESAGGCVGKDKQSGWFCQSSSWWTTFSWAFCQVIIIPKHLR